MCAAHLDSNVLHDYRLTISEPSGVLDAAQEDLLEAHDVVYVSQQLVDVIAASSHEFLNFERLKVALQQTLDILHTPPHSLYWHDTV